MRINLDAVYLNVATDPTDMLRFESASRLRQPRSRAVEYMDVAGRGVRQQVTQVRRAPWALVADRATQAEADWIADHLGVLLCARDPYGGKMFGSYADADIEADPDRPGWWSVSLTLTAVYYSEAV